MEMITTREVNRKLNGVRVDRLQILAQGLRWVHRNRPEAFNINTWQGSWVASDRSRDVKQLRSANNPLKQAPQPACNTVACAAGWIPFIPGIWNDGLGIVRFGDSVRPVFQGDNSEAALMNFFQINYDDSDKIFFRNGYTEVVHGAPITALDVAKKIEHFLKTGEA